MFEKRGNLGEKRKVLLNVEKKLIFFYFFLGVQTGSGSMKVEVAKNEFWIEYSFPDDVTINITMSARCLGYVSMGFGLSMTNVDMITGSITSGKPNVVDQWSVSHDTPVEDNQGNIINFSGGRQGGISSFWFTRKLNTGDSSQDFIIVPNKQTSIIWAYGE